MNLQQNALIAQREYIEELEETIRQLREQLAPATPFPASLGLTKSQRIILAALLACSPQQVSRDRLMMALYPDADAAPESKTIEVFIFKMRATLKPLGVEIGSDSGYGWFLDRKSAEVLRQLVGGA